jgi:VanZ family protein
LLCIAHIDRNRIDYKENAERAVALLLEIFRFPCLDRVVTCLDHVPFPLEVTILPAQKKGSVLIRWGPVVLFAGLIFWLSSLTGVPRLGGWSDKLFHFAEYFLFALLLWRALTAEHRGTVDLRRALGVLLIGSVYAASDEVHQSLVPGRYASIYDWFADVAGILGMITLMISRVKWRGGAVNYHYEKI